MHPPYRPLPNRSTAAAKELHKAAHSIRSASRHFQQAFLHSAGNPESQRLLSFVRSLDALVAPLATIERSLT